MALELRAANESDAAFLGQVLQMAARGHLALGPWDLLFPEARERTAALEQLVQTQQRSWCHHAVFRIAALDGEASAAMVAFEPSELGGGNLGRALGEVFEKLAWASERTAGIGALLAPYIRCFPDMPDGTWIVENVGTRSDRRRRGLVGSLLEDALESGRRRGHREAQISCLIGNDPAQRAYEKLGFRVVEERVDPEFERRLGAPGFFRLKVAL
jgi:ribosomal protein S18 acetylase RimI-like enzyme